MKKKDERESPKKKKQTNKDRKEKNKGDRSLQ